MSISIKGSRVTPVEIHIRLDLKFGGFLPRGHEERATGPEEELRTMAQEQPKARLGAHLGGLMRK